MISRYSEDTANSGGWADSFIDDIAERVVRKMEERRLLSLSASPRENEPIGYKSAKGAAEFLGLNDNQFRKIAPTLKRYRISKQRYHYSIKALQEWMDAHETGKEGDYEQR